MTTPSNPIEMRADPERAAWIAQAAAAQHMSVSAFVLDAAAREASRILGRAELTLMPVDQFDAFVGALEQADAAPHLAAAAAARRDTAHFRSPLPSSSTRATR